MKNKLLSLLSYSLFLLAITAYNVDAITLFDANTLPELPLNVESDTIKNSALNEEIETTDYFKCASHTSYDPHDQLLHYTELEAGRVVLHIDAFHGQPVHLKIKNQLGVEMTKLSIPKVTENYIHIDVAAWDCGKYTIMHAQESNEWWCYQFEID